MPFSLSSLLNSTSRFEKAVDRYNSVLRQINELEDAIAKKTDQELRGALTSYKGKSLEEMRPDLPIIFATVREAAKRTLHMRHFDVQILGGLALLDNTISEMKTGEGKTLVATLPLITHALTGKGAHLVTVNDYLSSRDAEWMRPVYEFFGLKVACVLSGQSPAEKKAAYQADITYGTNNEFGFDYLRDNMATSVDRMVMRPLHFAIIDEVDSILIDEARTPLIISAPDAESTKLYGQFAQIVPQLKENDHYNIDERRRAATLTDDGISRVEQILGIDNIYAEHGVRMVHHLEQALRAQTLFHKDKDYVVKDNQVVIVDEFTGRLMQGRRYSEGLHQAIEAKEHVTVQQESRTLATITFQNFFRLYKHLSGMTGTAVTSAEEFEKVYNLDVVVIPTNQAIARINHPDRIYVNEEAKFKAVVEDIKERHKNGQPVLVGTIAIEKSEHIAGLLMREGIPHEVLNAKNHAREADIITNAGQQKAITISTNMAGRGTDIKLGDGVADKGGLYVIGTERHEARRIDNQLRGRSGRQGDPGETRFYVSLEDDVMRIFGGERIQRIMSGLKVPENEPIENKLVSRAIEKAQERVEGYYFDMRKQVLSYDDVLNKQRDAIYTLRRGILEKNSWQEKNVPTTPLDEYLQETSATLLVEAAEPHITDTDPEKWDIREISETLHSLLGSETNSINTKLSLIRTEEASKDPEQGRAAIREAIIQCSKERFQARREELGVEIFERLLSSASMRAIDVHWMDHLDTMDYLRTGIGLRGYGQRDPLVEYQKESYQLFQRLLATIKATIVETIFKAEQINTESQRGTASHPQAANPGGSPASEQEQQPLSNPHKDIGRNDPCYCGSEKKYKKCHGR